MTKESDQVRCVFQMAQEGGPVPEPGFDCLGEWQVLQLVLSRRPWLVFSG